MKKLSKKIEDQVLKLAKDYNLKGKRLLSTRLEVCENIIKDLDLKREPMELLNWFEALPVAAKTAKDPKVSNRLPVDTMTGSSAARSELMPIIETDQAVIVTSAQNNTACAPVFDQLVRLAAILNAKLIILPVYYNKAAFDPSVEEEQERFNDQVKPYLLDHDAWLYGRGAVRLAAEAAILPTAKLPINAAQAINAGELFTIVGSPKQQYRTLPTLNSAKIPKAWASATCTAFNYKRGRAGTEAETQHVFGGTLFTKDDSGAINSTNIRQGSDGSIKLYLQETGEFITLDHHGEYTVDHKSPNVCKLGDLHCEMYDPIQWQNALDFVGATSPQFIAVDDILHFSTRSHHQRTDSKHLYATRNERVTNDLAQVISQLNQLAQIAPVYVTESNHNSALDNWLADSSVKIDYDAHNAKIYHLLKWLVMDTLDQGENAKNALQIALENADLTTLPALAENVEFGRMDRPMFGFNYDFSQHGHKGQNGSAATPAQLAKLNMYLVSGHTHSPCIIGTQFVTGVTAKLKQGYNRGGASSWDHAHVMEHSNGECQQVNTNPQVP